MARFKIVIVIANRQLSNRQLSMSFDPIAIGPFVIHFLYFCALMQLIAKTFLWPGARTEAELIKLGAKNTKRLTRVSNLREIKVLCINPIFVSGLRLKF
jgi:hypothetical protein